MTFLNWVRAGQIGQLPPLKKHGKGGCDAMSVGAHVEQTCLKALIDLLGLGIMACGNQVRASKAGNEPIGWACSNDSKALQLSALKPKVTKNP